MPREIKLFAYLAEAIAPIVTIDLPETLDRDTVLTVVAMKYPLAKKEIESCNVAIDQSYITDEKFSLTEVREIALIPPVSGG